MQQSRGWQHYALHRYVFCFIWRQLYSSSCTDVLFEPSSICSPEPHILLFRRVLGTNPQSGRVEPDLVAASRAEFKDQLGLRQNSVA